MTKAIEDALNLPRLEDALKELAMDQASEGETEVANAEVEKFANALQGVVPGALMATDAHGTTEHVIEADEIYDAAMRAHKDLLDLGFNIEPKHAGANAFAPAAKFLELALKASQSKNKTKMDKIKAIMEQEKHDNDLQKNVEDGEIIDNGGQSITANRNDIMTKIRNGEI